MPSNASTPFDVFAYDNSGTVALEALAWTNDTTRATALVLQDGVYVKSGATTRRYLGTGRTTGTSGQCEDSTSRRFLWNYYNRVPRFFLAYSTVDSWTYQSAAWRAANGGTTVGTYRIELVVGLAEAWVHARYDVRASHAGSALCAAGIGINSTTLNSATIFAGGSVQSQVMTPAQFDGYLAAGFSYITMLEIWISGAAAYWYGDDTSSSIRNGLSGHVMG